MGMYECKDPDSGDKYSGPIKASDTTVQVYYGSGKRGGMLSCTGPSAGAEGTVVAGYKCDSMDTRAVALADESGITFDPNKMPVYDATRNGNSLSVDGGRIKVTWSDSA